METVLVAVISAVLGGGVLGLVQFLIDRADKKNGFQAKVEAEMLELKRSASRTNLMMLMERHPMDTYQILQEAQHYFVDLDGNWYMHSLFEHHCQSYAIPLPEWYSKKNETRATK